MESINQAIKGHMPANLREVGETPALDDIVRNEGSSTTPRCP